MLYVYLVLYVLILIGVSWYISKKENKEGFLIANRDRGWFTVFMSKFATSIEPRRRGG